MLRCDGRSAMKLVTQPARSYPHALSAKSRAERDYIPTWSSTGSKQASESESVCMIARVCCGLCTRQDTGHNGTQVLFSGMFAPRETLLGYELHGGTTDAAQREKK